MSSCAETVRVLHPRCDEDLFLFDEGLIKDTVTRERKRTDRSGLAMVMLLVGVLMAGPLIRHRCLRGWPTRFRRSSRTSILPDGLNESPSCA